jgi:hypothetical protein
MLIINSISIQILYILVPILFGNHNYSPIFYVFVVKSMDFSLFMFKSFLFVATR